MKTMREPKLVIYDSAEGLPQEPVREYCVMPSGDYVVMVGKDPNRESLWFDREGKHPKTHLVFEERSVPDEDKLLMFVQQRTDGKIITAICNDGTLSYEHFGLIVADVARHVARAFKVSEDEVWEWVDKERANPTTELGDFRPM